MQGIKIETKKISDKLVKWNSQVRKGLLEFLILNLLTKEDYYGYELIKAINKLTSLSITEGTVYPLLKRLENEKFINSKWIHKETAIPRKYYNITDSGKIILTEMKNSWTQLNDNLKQFLL